MMSISLHAAVQHLYQTAVVQGNSQSPARLSGVAEICVRELENRGLRNVETEVAIPGAGRTKQWDVAWMYDGKYRLGISLKSLLKNIPGTVPNRIDDLMGEVANAQLYSPEIVIGYLMLFDVSQNSYSKKHGKTWLDLFRDRITSLSGRQPPSWTPGTIESHVIVEIDFSRGCALESDPSILDAFFDTMVSHICHRNPNAIRTQS